MRVFAIDWEELNARKKVRVMLGKNAVLIVEKDGVPYAVADRCPHMGASLFHGDYHNGIVKCKLHGAEFDIVNGTVVERPHLLFLKMRTKTLETYPATVEKGKVFLELPEPSK
jgi:3-phenylpropionate/trans-cinnamate dioxygenase ferredoxin subunit